MRSILEVGSEQLQLFLYFYIFLFSMQQFTRFCTLIDRTPDLQAVPKHFVLRKTMLFHPKENFT